MEYQKIINLLGNMADQAPRYVTKKWMDIYDESGGTCNVNKEVRFKTPQLRNDLCDYNEVYTVVAGKINIANPNNNAYDKKLALKNNAPFLKEGFKITVSWNKYLMECQISNQTANNNLNYLIDPTFDKVHRLFVFRQVIFFKILHTYC